MATASRAASSPEPLPSLPSSPVEEDIGRAGGGHEDGTFNNMGGSPKSKGKQRARPREPSDVDEEEQDEEDTGTEQYPPTNDEEAEARRVEENLRLWEKAERQRRKAARESKSSGSGGHTFVGDVTQKASLLWQGKRSKRPSLGGVGTHHVLRNRDDGVPLDDIDSPPVSARFSLEPGENPFVTPSASTTSLNVPDHSAVMTGSSVPPTPPDDNEERRLAVPVTKRSSLSSPPRINPPAPQPLGLPKPRTPPPRTTTPHANRPPEPHPEPAVSDLAIEEEEVSKPTRWWTDWLCGCLETGDHQAGRTNPFE